MRNGWLPTNLCGFFCFSQHKHTPFSVVFFALLCSRFNQIVNKLFADNIDFLKRENCRFLCVYVIFDYFVYNRLSWLCDFFFIDGFASLFLVNVRRRKRRWIHLTIHIYGNGQISLQRRQNKKLTDFLTSKKSAKKSMFVLWTHTRTHVAALSHFYETEIMNGHGRETPAKQTFLLCDPFAY